MAAPLLLIVLMSGAVQAQTTPPPDTTDGDGPPPFATPAQTPVTPGQPGAVPSEPVDPVAHPVVRPFEMPSSYRPSAPVAYAPQPATAATAAVQVERYRGEYEGPADEQQRYYLMGVQGKFETEQAMMGALDGEWTVTAQTGGPLFTVVIDDAGGGAPVDSALGATSGRATPRVWGSSTASTAVRAP